MNPRPAQSLGNQDDPFDLARFVQAQKSTYAQALSEVESGQKRSHWMWYIFPQLRGLGQSATAQFYGIGGVEEARAYLAHDVLGPRLITVCEAALSVNGRTATAIFGTPDDLKLRSCVTLFAQISDTDSVFHRLLQKYFNGEPDPRTLQLLTQE